MRCLLVVALCCLVMFSFFEISAGWWLLRNGNPLDITRKILEVDNVVGWRQKANLKTDFLGKPLMTNELGWRTYRISDIPDNRRRTLILGPSSTFGWGIEEAQTYSAQLEGLLKDEAIVLNGGEIGYSSYQGLRLFSQKEVSEIDPDIVVIAYGLNDLDRHRFYFQSNKSDKEEFLKARPKFVFGFLNLAYSSSTVNILMKSVTWLNLQLSSISSLEAPKRVLRVDSYDFTGNLSNLVEKARDQGSAVVLLTTAVNLDMDSDVSGLNVFRVQEIDRIKEGVENYNNIVRSIAAEKNVPLGDLESWFSGKNKKDLFVDPVHFSPLGNQIIAQNLHDIILQNRLLD